MSQYETNSTHSIENYQFDMKLETSATNLLYI